MIEELINKILNNKYFNFGLENVDEFDWDIILSQIENTQTKIKDELGVK